jgi:alanyl-tRNA synthetase
VESVGHQSQFTGVILLSGNEIRSTFLKFFAERGHRVVRSSSLVPTNDPTLLFTNAGMNQFKDVFLGLEQREYTRATSSQKCVRAGGKHNDLENVGFTNRHHTFFEMLGNFSFGDYFKKDAIAYAWELITSTDWFGIPVDKLYFTVFGGAELAPGTTLGTDEEAMKLWADVGAPPDRIIPVPGLKENFWAMGDTGPCGPCSEIFFDMGPAASDQGHTDCKFGCDCGRYVEIWNLVFMQFNRDASGAVEPLPKPSIDTGAGLERLAAVLQGKISNYDTDLFQPLIRKAALSLDVDLRIGPSTAPSLRIIADHARATTFLITDGVIPSNDGRGYVLRKIIRRAIRHGRLLGVDRPFFAEMVFAVRDLMGKAYPELLDPAAARVPEIVSAEERRFAHAIDKGLKEWDAAILKQRADDYYDFLLKKLELDKSIAGNDSSLQAAYLGTATARGRSLDEFLEEKVGKDRAKTLKSDWDRSHKLRILGDAAFKLYDTYGLPVDFMIDLARDAGIEFDQDGFERAMEDQRTRARASWKGGHKEAAKPVYLQIADAFTTERDFYGRTKASDCRIEAIVKAGVSTSHAFADEEVEIILDRTPIYAESGGQVADVGVLYDKSESQRLAEVRGAYYPVSGLIAHRVVVKEDIQLGDRVTVIADGARREHIKRNHTGTHLMHAALRNILGTHVKQAGSLVEPSRLRFDFSHFAAIDPAELRDIEQQVNDEILLNSEIQTNIMPLDDALASGALAFFGDRYPEQNVRVVTIPDPSAPRGFYSKELCGGTHVRRTGDIGIFKIVVEQSAAAGVRRIEAITGAAALADYQRSQQLLREISLRMGVNEENLSAAIERTEQTQRQMEKQLEAMKRKGALSKLDELAAQARTIKGVKVISAQLEGVDREAMRQLVDSLRQKLGSGVVVLGTAEDGKVALLAGITKDLTSKLHAGKVIQEIAKKVGGSGGGRPDLAEAGGKDTFALKSALDQVYPLIDQLL